MLATDVWPNKFCSLCQRICSVNANRTEECVLTYRWCFLILVWIMRPFSSKSTTIIWKFTNAFVGGSLASVLERESIWNILFKYFKQNFMFCYWRIPAFGDVVNLLPLRRHNTMSLVLIVPVFILPQSHICFIIAHMFEFHKLDMF